MDPECRRRAGRVGRGVLTSHSAVEMRLSWLLLFARAKRSNSLLRSRGESPALKLPLSYLPLAIELRGYRLGLGSCRLERPSKGWSGAGSRAFAPLRGASHLIFARAKKRGPKKHAPASAPSPLRVPGPLRRRDFSTRPSCDAAGAGAVASRRQPAHRGEAVLRLFPVRPCRVEKRRASLHAALRVFPAGSVAAEGDPEGKRQKPKAKSQEPRAKS